MNAFALAKPSIARAALVSIAFVAALPAHAEPSVATLNQNVWLQIGAFRPSIDSSVQIDHPTSGAAGTDVDFENELGLAKKKTTPSLLLGARFADRWRAEFEYFRLNRSASQSVLESSITIDDTVYPVNAAVDSRFDSQVFRAGIGYSFFKTPAAEAGAVLGVHVTKFRIDVEGVGSVDGAPVAATSVVQNKTVPLPTIGLYGTWAVAPNWAIGARADLLSLKVRQYRGKLLNVQANVIYRFTENVGVGLGYRFNDYRLKAERDDFRGRVDYKFRGPQVFLDAGF